MENEIRIGEKILRYEECSPAQFQKFGMKIGKKVVAIEFLREFIKKVEEGDVSIICEGIGNKIESAYSEVYKMMKEVGEVFFEQLMLNKAKLEGVELTRKIFYTEFNMDNVEAITNLFDSIRQYTSTVPTEQEVKN